MRRRQPFIRDRIGDRPDGKRRTLIKALAALPVAAPMIFSRRAHAGEQVIVRTAGGAFEDVIRKAIFEPFTKETGIEVVPVPANSGKIFAMFKSGNVELDVIAEFDEGPLLNLSRQGFLAPVDYDAFKLTDLNDIDASLRKPDHIYSSYFSNVLAYNTQAFPNGSHPKTWVEFWDLGKFPGPRTLPDIATGTISLEFALIADGVPMDKLYPLDIDRAFKSLDRIRAAVPKFWSGTALGVEMLTRKEAVAADMWNARVQAAVNAGDPVAIEWNQAMTGVSGIAIPKGAPNMANAKRYMDFALRPESQFAVFSTFPQGPVNQKALAKMSPALLDTMPSSPKHLAQSFRKDVPWWEDNRENISRKWAQWLLQKT